MKIEYRISDHSMFGYIGVQHRVSTGVEDGRRPTVLRLGQSRNSHKAVSAVANPQGMDGSIMVGPGETLKCRWPPLAIHLCLDDTVTQNLLFLEIIQLIPFLTHFVSQKMTRKSVTFELT
jgi:hypothetical protein